MSAWLEQVLAFLFARFGRWNISVPLARIYGAQTKARFPNLPEYGNTPGCKRSPSQMIVDACKNRTYVRFPSHVALA